MEIQDIHIHTHTECSKILAGSFVIIHLYWSGKEYAHTNTHIKGIILTHSPKLISNILQDKIFVFALSLSFNVYTCVFINVIGLIEMKVPTKQLCVELCGPDHQHIN